MKAARPFRSQDESHRSGRDRRSGSDRQVEDRMRILFFACSADDAQRAQKYGERMETAYIPSYDMEEIRQGIERFKPKLVICSADAFLRAFPPLISSSAPHSQQRSTTTLRQSDPPSVTPRELKVLAMVAKGQTNDEIARGLRVSSRTVKRILSDLFVQLNAGNRTELSSRAARFGLTEND
jgi:DNA-binding NarL/FixJ family response regulator